MLKHYVIVIVVEFDYVIVVDVLNLSHNGRKMVKLDFKLMYTSPCSACVWTSQVQYKFTA